MSKENDFIDYYAKEEAQALAKIRQCDIHSYSYDLDGGPL